MPSQPPYRSFAFLNGYARNPAEAASPTLWRDLIGLYVPNLFPSSDSLVDLSGTGNTLARQNDTGIVFPRRQLDSRGYVLRFDGTTTIGMAASANKLPTANDALTLMVWCNTYVASASRTILQINDSPTAAGTRITLGLVTGVLRVIKTAGATLLDSGYTPTVDTWTHVAYTWDGNTNRIYVNGALLATSTTAHDTATLTTIWLGFAGGGGVWSGLLDMPVIYRRALTPEEVALYAWETDSPLRLRPQRLIVTPPGPQTVTPDPVVAVWAVNTPTATPGPRAMTLVPVVAQWAVNTPTATNVNTVSPAGVAAAWAVNAPFLTIQQLPRQVSSAVSRALASTFIAGDWLIEASALNLKLSYDYNPDGTWEHRIHSIGDIEFMAPPGGGVTAVANATVGVIEDDSTSTLLTRWENLGTTIGATMTIDLLLAGQSAPLRLWTGQIDSIVTHDAIATINGADQSQHVNPLMPQHLITASAFPNAASAVIDRAQPLVYGQGFITRLQTIPSVLVDTQSNLYLIAGHPVKNITGGPGVSTISFATLNPTAGTWMPATTTTAAVCNTSATFTMSASIQTFQYNFISAGGPSYLQLSINEDVLSATNAFDGNPLTLAYVLTSNTASNLDGEGRLGVAMSAASQISAHRGNNTVFMTLTNHRRSTGSDTTVTGTFTVNTINPTSLSALRTNLFTSIPYRQVLNPQTSILRAPSLTLGGTEAVEILLTANNEGGPGNASQKYEIGEISIQSFYQPQGDVQDIVLYRSNNVPIRGDNFGVDTNSGANIEGRADTTGVITGGSGAAITLIPHVIRSIFELELGLPTDTTSAQFLANYTYYRARDMFFDGGIGAGWSIERQTVRELLDDLALQGTCTIYPQYDGDWAVTPYDPDHTAIAADFDVNNILAEYGTEDQEPVQRSSTFRATLGTMEHVHTRFEVYYSYNTGTRKFDHLLYADQDGTNDTADGEIVVEPCRQAYIRYGTLPTYKIEAHWISDENTARWLLRHIVGYWSAQRVECEFETTLVAATLTVGNMVTITHPMLPEKEQGQPFEVHTIRYKPMVGRVYLKCSRPATLPMVLRPQPVVAAWRVNTPTVTNLPPLTWTEAWTYPDYSATVVYVETF